MSKMVLVRHAQASFFADDYDQLSPLGKEQSLELGHAFVRNGARFDRVFIGPNLRHKQTAQGIAEQFESNGIDFPDMVCLEELAEHTADVLVREMATELAELDPRFEKMVSNYRSAKEPHEIQKSFQILFESTVRLWTENRINSPGCEPWEIFHSRVQEGIRKIISSDTGSESILVVSSVGPLSVILKQALELSITKALELGWRLRNASVSHLLFKGERITVDHFNSVSHLLEKPEMITYR